MTAPYVRGDYRFAPAEKNCDLRLLDFETFGGFGDGVRKNSSAGGGPAE